MTDQTEHERYVVRCSQSGQFIGAKRYSYSRGTYANLAKSLGTARIFARECDAEAARPDDDWEVLPVRISLA